MLIQADLHTHTIASAHAYSTVTENAGYASEIGLKAIAMTDHTNLMPDSAHIWHFRNAKRVLPRQIHGVTVIRGAEVNIAGYSGGLDVKDSDLDWLEWVIASYHSHCFENFRPADPETVTDGYIEALKNPKIDMIGHPTASNFPVEWERLVPAAKEAGVILELNESSIKTGKSPAAAVTEMLNACKKYGCLISLDSDAHFWSLIGGTGECEKAIRETQFPLSLIANADWDCIRAIILKKHPECGI